MNSALPAPILQIPMQDGKSLLPFQFECVTKMIEFLEACGAVYNACEMRLGKTVQTIATLNYFRASRILVVCPASVAHVWEKEFESFWVLTRKTFPIEIVKSAKDLKSKRIETARVVICSYGLAASDKAVESFTTRKPPYNFEFLICDEAFYLKNRNAKRTKAILNGLWDKIPYHICLAGTPFTDCVTDGFTLFKKMAPKHFGNYYEFANRYAHKKITPFGTSYYGVRNEGALSKLIRSNFFVRKTKEEVIKDLPERIWQEIPIDSSYAVKSLEEFNAPFLEQSIKELELKIQNNEPINQNAPWIKSLRHAQGINKVKPVAEFVAELLDQGLPVVLFAFHKAVIEKLALLLADHKPRVITGDTPIVSRTAAIEAFQEGKTNLIICNLVAGGVGVRLDRADICVMAEFSYSPHEIQQAVERIWAMEKSKGLLVYYFKVLESLEEKIINILLTKADSFSRVLECQNQPSKGK